MSQVDFLPLSPWWFGGFVGICTAVNDFRHSIAKFLPDLLQDLPTTLVFGTIVQQPGDRLIFAASVLEYQGSDSHQVCQVRRLGPLSHLLPVKLEREIEGLSETVGYLHV